MNRDRLNYGETIAGVSAILLSYFMFLNWFGSKDAGELQLFSVGRNAWEALDYIPIVLVIAIAAALVAPALRLTKLAYKTPVAVNAMVGVLGIVSTLLIFFRIVKPPNFGSRTDTFGTVPIESTVQFPIFLALLAAAGIAFGGCLAMREEGISLSDLRPRRQRDQGLPPRGGVRLSAESTGEHGDRASPDF